MSTQSHIDKVNLQPMVMEYAAHVGAPRIEPQDLTSFKKQGLNKVDRVMKKRYDELVKEVETLQISMMVNQEVSTSQTINSNRKLGKYITYMGILMVIRHCLSLDPRNGINHTCIRWF